MNFWVNDPKAKHVELHDTTLWVELKDGRKLGTPLAYFPRLLNASPEDRKKFTISGGGIGLHWDDLDEDISVKGLLSGIGDQSGQSKPLEHAVDLV